MKKVIAMILVVTSLLLLASCGKTESYKIQFTIPVGNSENFVFSDQEISPTGSKITLSTDTAVVLKLSQVREENSYELTTSLMQGTSIEVPVEKDTWYKIGVTTESPSDVNTVVNVEIGGVEVRIE
ncbi:MAG: hypothetical protein J6B26_07200 [Agathobacter sp.]|nr:hypothetical protein [Agathobacter sp.]